ncbi:hypothetical protein HNR31_001445 [Anoxybacillus caldiproteolyticus]|uniref:Uncharacterized protein n=1 Tax=Thermaerobacillus caldiproteolyticus TaxID=247480 RepID=A0A7W0C011_9BACL|nr:hypothetical protein [Anoxybacillus caldiproteolyticus]
MSNALDYFIELKPFLTFLITLLLAIVLRFLQD